MTGSQGHNFVSPLRYPGGKGKVANFLKLTFLKNQLVGHQYVELYAGGASVALALLFEEYTPRVHINDLNRSVHAFWAAVLNHTDELCARIHDTPVSMDEWHRQKAVQLDGDAGTLDLGFSTFFLNRTNRSGIIQGGVIGGKAQTGSWKLDARFNKPDLVARIKRIARYRSRIQLTRCDAATYLKTVAQQLPAKAFFFLDPPYYVKGEGLYEHSYQHEDHVQIAQLLRGVKKPWVVSYDAAQQILDLYEDYSSIRYDLSYSAHSRYRGSEAIFLSPDLELPEVSSPSGVGSRVLSTALLDYAAS
jgi:DNA adenine methylase